MTNRPFKKGDTVALKASIRATWNCANEKDNPTAEIRAAYGQTGEVWLDHHMCGSVYWDQNDLVLVQAVEDKPR